MDWASLIRSMFFIRVSTSSIAISAAREGGRGGGRVSRGKEEGEEDTKDSEQGEQNNHSH